MGAALLAIRRPPPGGVRGFTDERLVALVASGDDQAFAAIVDRYSPALLSFCVRMLGSREWGEDALQLTFVAAYKALRRDECAGGLRPWLYAIARNRCLSELRARREIPDSDWVGADRQAIDGPASLLARREQLREVVEDIQRLPADQRAALVLFELGDQSHEEIATVLGVRREKVKALIFQAREGLYRGRCARERACSEVREQVANARGNVPARGIVRAHIDRCAPCQEFELEVRRQRAALALILPVAVSGKLKALVLSSALGHNAGAGAATVNGAGGASALAGASTASSGSGAIAGPGSLAGAAASAGSGSTAVGGGAVGAVGGAGAVSAAASTAAPGMVASALGTDAVVGAGALTSSVSVPTVAKLATVVAVAVGVGGVARSELVAPPGPRVSLLTGQPTQSAPPRSPLQPLVSGIAGPVAGPSQPGSQSAADAAAAGAPQTGTAGAPSSSSASSSSSPAPSSSADPPAGSASSTPSAGAISPPPPTSAPAGSAPGIGSATTAVPSSGSSMTTPATTTTTTTSTASSPTTASAGSSSGASGSQGTSGGSSGATGSHRTSGGSSSTRGSGPAASSGQEGQSSGGDPGGGATHSIGNGPPITPPGCMNNPAPGCAKKTPRS